jgi:low density lipoprotein receptor-related protein 5/6
MKRTLAALALCSVLLLAVSATAVEKIYFGDVGHDKIRRCDFNGFNIEELVTTGLSAVGSIAIDRTGGKMYWADWPEATAHIRRSNLDGSDVEVIHSGLSGPYGVALDVTAGKLYWTEFSANMVRRSNLDGTNVEDLITTGLSHPNGIALDLDNGKIYGTQGGVPGKVFRANLDGTGFEWLITTRLSEPMEIALDLDSNKMYWCDLGTDSLYRSDLDGSNIEALLASEYGTPVGIDLDLAAGKIYYSDSGAGSKIKRANLDGTGVQDLISTGIGACYGLTLGPAEAECSDADLDGPWLIRIVGAAPYDYTAYLTYDGQGTIDDLGAFGVPDSAGEYSVYADCDFEGYLWTDGYSPFDGHLDTDSTGTISLGGLGPLATIKVMDVGALEGCWTGSFIQDTTLTTYNVTINIDATGTVTSAIGFPNSMDGNFYYQSPYVAGFMAAINSLGGSPWDEIMIHDATLSPGGNTMSGTFALDCSDCPRGTFSLTVCPAQECTDASLDGPWLTRVIGAAPYDYTVYMTYDGLGEIDDIGAFGTPDSAGEYSVYANCDFDGYVWSDGYTPFNGHIFDDSTATVNMNGLGPLAMIKVMDVGALEGCWAGTFIQDTTLTTYNVTINIDATGTITSTAGFLNPMNGHFYYQFPYVAGFMETGSAPTGSPWDEIMILDATRSTNGAVMSGTFALDCSDCPRGTFFLALCDASGIDDRSPAPSSELHPNYPNPFNPRTTLAYSLREAGHVNLRIYDAAGRLVRTLLSEDKPAGTYTKVWNGRDDNGAEVSSGVYFVRFETGNDVHARKIVFLK